jgi:predicted nucleotidyltransferase
MPTEQQINFGLSERDIKTIASIFKKFPEIETVHIFGSRALDKYKAGSDIDLAIINHGISDDIIKKIQIELGESSLPYRVDLINLSALNHTELADHINRVGLPFYIKQI